MNKEELLQLVQLITDAFYQNKAEEGADKLPDLIHGLSGYASNLDAQSMVGYIAALKNMMEAMEMEDYVMIADILTFDILDYIR